MAQYAKAYFSPDKNARQHIIGFIDRTQKDLDIAVYAVTDDLISDAIIRAHNRGVAVRVLMDDLQAASRYADDEKMQAAGVPLRLDIRSAAMHNKFAISDKSAVMTGSYNWTLNAATRNSENWVIIWLKYMIHDYYQPQFEKLWADNAPT